MPKIEYTLTAVNQRLKEGRIKAMVKQRGEMLYLQATLPPKPRSDRPKAYQQVVSLGVPANESGFRRAEDEARKLSTLLTFKEFDWAMYTDEDRLPENRSAKFWINEFKSHYFETHSLKEGTWKGDWEKIYKRLKPNEPVTSEILLNLTQATERNTRNRLETANKLQKLADFIGLKIDLRQFRGNYGASKVRDRDVPSDEDIAIWWSKIPNPNWQWIYGAMAAFGLRDHEAFFCEWRKDGLFVTKGKTGPRLIYEALYPEWVNLWDLETIRLPKVKDLDRLYEERKLGDKVARQFRRYKIPFPPYALRHAFGIRSSVTFPLAVTVAADLMGHSEEIHFKRYHRHVKLEQKKDGCCIMENDDLGLSHELPSLC